MVRFTRIRCSACDCDAPSLIACERDRLVRLLTGQGWRLTLGEATCPVCVAEEGSVALAPTQRVAS